MNDAPILLAEDNPDDVLLTRRAFAKTGFDNPVLDVPDGEACLDALLAETAPDSRTGPAAEPAFLLLDINLPKINGLDVLRRLRSDPHTRLLPVVLLTTSREQRDVLAGYRLGANSYVCKPVSFTGFVAVIHTLATYWLRVNEPRPLPGGPR